MQHHGKSSGWDESSNGVSAVAGSSCGQSGIDAFAEEVVYLPAKKSMKRVMTILAEQLGSRCRNSWRRAENLRKPLPGQ